MQKKGFIDPKKSITFKLVHRPQTDRTGKDALLLQPMQPSLNLQRKGFQPDLDFSMVQSSEDEQDPCSEEENLVDQSDFGVYFNDDYDYLQHLKTVGQDPNSVILSTKPTESHRGIKFVEPSDTLALDSLSSEKLFYDPKLISLEGLDQGLPRTTENDSNVDPSIKEIFVALEDEAYVEDGLDEDFFDAFNQDSLPDKYSSFAGTMPSIPEEPWISEFQK
jgi:protein LTV1